MNHCDAQLGATRGARVNAQDLVDFGRTLGFSRVGVIADITETATALDADKTPLARKFGWPDWVINAWVEKQFTLFNPINLTARKKHLPFAWRCERMSSEIGHKKPREKQVLDFLLGIKSSCGIAVPIHQPHGKIGIVMWSGSDDSQDLENLLSHTEREFLFLSYKLLQKIDDAEQQSSPDLVVLSERERECLKWSARGKTDKDIALILSISPLTVRSYIDSAVRKLDTSNRVHGVAKACMMGLISPF